MTSVVATTTLVTLSTDNARSIANLSTLAVGMGVGIRPEKLFLFSLPDAPSDWSNAIKDRHRALSSELAALARAPSCDLLDKIGEILLWGAKTAVVKSIVIAVLWIQIPELLEVFRRTKLVSVVHLWQWLLCAVNDEMSLKSLHSESMSDAMKRIGERLPPPTINHEVIVGESFIYYDAILWKCNLTDQCRADEDEQQTDRGDNAEQHDPEDNAEHPPCVGGEGRRTS
jgi:hypothetical protein